MNIHAEYQTLPLGAIKAKGFLKEQLERNRDGMGGHLPELEPGMIANPYVNKTYVKRWGNGDQSGWGAEISGNYYAGLIQLAYTLDDEGLKEKATEWVNAVIAKKRADGYLGTYYEPDAKIYEDYNAWGNACGMRALLFYYEATGREDVFDAVYGCMKWFTRTWAGDKKTTYSGQFIMEPMLYCYERTGDEELLQFCLDYSEFLSGHRLFRNSVEDFADPVLHYNSNHSVCYGTSLAYITRLYRATGDKKYLDALKTGIRKVVKKCMQLHGGIASLSEYIAPIGSTTETEYCAFSVFNSRYIALAETLGEAKYGDYLENVTYNGGQGARKKDERAIAYMSTPNQIFATDSSDPAFDINQVYSPCFPVSCCPVLSVSLVPEFLRGMAGTDKRGNLRLLTYGPASIDYGEWHVEVRTLYPFRNEITLRVNAPNGKKLIARIPGWCKEYRVTVDGKEVKTAKNGSGFVSIPVSDECEVKLVFRAEKEIIRVNDSDFSAKHPLAFRYGALLFSLPIESEWIPYYPETETPLTPEWPWYKVKPVLPSYPADMDPHEVFAYRRDRFSFSVAVSERIKAEDIEVVETEASGYVWEDPPIRLRVPGYRAPLANAPYAWRTFEPYGEYAEVTEKIDMTLVPYGATNLRITYFPRSK